MDLLASWNMDELPEQQTRMMHLMEQHPTDFDLRLGFDACCTCATPLTECASTSIQCDEVGVGGSGGGKKFRATSIASTISCPTCRRVSYCSEACRRQDAEALMTATSDGAEGEDEEKAMGHSSIICALLQTCHDDETVEYGDEDADLEDIMHNTRMDATRRQASLDRIRSEFQSYPATLANVLCDGPCYQRVLSSKSSANSKTLIVHVIGASEQAELWGDAPESAMLDDDDDDNDDKNDSSGPKKSTVDKHVMIQAYAHALAELVERFQLDLVQLVMFGPECPDQNLQLSCSIPCTATNSTARSSTKKDNDDDDDTVAVGQVVLKTFKGEYHELIQNHSNNNSSETNVPDIVVFFNPGFTVPDYDWRATLRAIPAGTPFLVCTNTELEGIADVQFLLDQDRVQSIPAGMADIFGLHYQDYNNNKGGDDENDASGSSSSFFSENPFCGTRVRQSGTMANDLFVKNRWMLGGITDSFDASRRSSSAAMDSESPKKRKTNTNTSSTSNNNTKASNPALI